jgi:hypothetical protein
LSPAMSFQEGENLGALAGCALSPVHPHAPGLSHSCSSALQNRQRLV